MQVGLQLDNMPAQLLKAFQTLTAGPDMEVFIDVSYAKALQHSAGDASSKDEAIGKSRADNTSKIHLAVDACGLPVVFEVTGGQINDLHPGVRTDCQGSRHREVIREQVEQQGAKAVIP